MAEPEAYTLSPKTAKAVQALLAAPDAYAPGGFGGRETTGGVSAVLEILSLVSLAPRPHYLAKPDNARGLSLAPSAGNTVVVACLDPAGELAPGQFVPAVQFGTHLGKPLYWVDSAYYDIEVVTDVALTGAGCALTVTATLSRFRRGKATTTRAVPTSYTIPSACVEVPVGTPTATSVTTCSSGVATTVTTFNFTLQKVRVLACGACP